MKLLNKFWIISISLSLISNTAYSNDSVFIEKNTPAPFSGFLFSEQKGREIKQRLVEADYFEQLNKSLQIQIKLYENIETRNNEKYNILLDQNDRLAKNLYSERNMSTWEKLAYFGLGVLATVLTTYAIKQAVK